MGHILSRTSRVRLPKNRPLGLLALGALVVLSCGGKVQESLEAGLRQASAQQTDGGHTPTTNELQVTPATVTSWLGSTANEAGFVDGSGTAAKFHYPYGLALDEAGHLYVCDAGNSAIRKVDTATGMVSTLAGGKAGTADGVGTAAQFRNPYGICYHAGYLYVCDSDNHSIRKIAISTGEVTTFAGRPDRASTAGGVTLPWAIVHDTSYFYVSTWAGTVLRIRDSTAEVTTWVGLDSVYASADGVGTGARFSARINGLALDGIGGMYIEDRDNYLIRRANLPTAEVLTVAGAVRQGGLTDGVGSASRVNGSGGIAAYDSSNIIFTDSSNHVVRRLLIVNGIATVTTIAGTTRAVIPGHADGVGPNVVWHHPVGIVYDRKADVFYVSDNYNHGIRKMHWAPR